MRIGVIGSGQVGQTLAQGLKKHGYETRIASRSPEKLAGFSASSGIQAGTPADVAAWAEAVVLAVKGDAAEAALREAGAANVNGKLVIDTTNPIAHEPPEDGVLRFFTSPNDSLMERLQAAFPDAKLVKAFNSVGSPLMVNPVFPGGAKPTMFYCGNDAGARINAVVTASNAGGSSTAASDTTATIADAPAPPAPAPPVSITPPAIVGDAIVGSTLSLDTGSWTDPQATIGIVWQRCAADGTACVTIDGATGTTYTLTTDDIGSTIEAVVTAVNAGGSAGAASAPTAPVVAAPAEPAPVTAPPAP